MATKNRDAIDKYYSSVKEVMKDSNKDEFSKSFIQAFEGGERTVYQKNMSETKKFDTEWIDTVESYFPSIDKITRDPKSTLMYEEDLVSVEKAKNVTQKSVRHLAANTQYIKEVDASGKVTPNKILIDRAEQNFAIYENRFIMTLIKRLFYFVRNRYEIIINNVESYQKDHVNAESNFEFNNSKINMKIDLEITKDLDDHSINEHNEALLKRVEELNVKVNGLKNCQFMKMLSDAKDVHPPIMKTNIISKNPDFRNAYNLWLFLDKYSILGYDVDVKEKNLEFDEEYITELEHLFLINYSTILANQNQRADLYNSDEKATTYTRKKTKIAKTNPVDFVPNPDLINVEDTTLNEYFLLKYKEIFDKAINALARDKDDDESIVYDVNDASDDAIKKALKQTIDITNSLYESKFNFEEDEDILKALVTTVDLDKEYSKSKEQLRYAHLIHDTKRVDYNNSLRLERKTIKDLESINKHMIEKLKSERNNESNQKKLREIENQINEKLAENEALKKSVEELDDYSKLTKEEEFKLSEERISSINRVVNDMKAYDAALKAKFEEDKAKLQKIFEDEKNKLIELKKQAQEASKKRRNMILTKLAQVRKEQIDDYHAKKAKALEKHNALVQEIKDKLAGDKAVLDEEFKQEEQAQMQQEKEDNAIYVVKMYEDSLKEQEELKVQEEKQAKELIIESEKALEDKANYKKLLSKTTKENKAKRHTEMVAKSKQSSKEYMLKLKIDGDTALLKQLQNQEKLLKERIQKNKEKAKELKEQKLASKEK